MYVVQGISISLGDHVPPKTYRTNPHVREYKYRTTSYPGKPKTQEALSYQCRVGKHFNQCFKLNCTCSCHVTGVAPKAGA